MLPRCGCTQLCSVSVTVQMPTKEFQEKIVVLLTFWVFYKHTEELQLQLIYDQCGCFNYCTTVCLVFLSICLSF